MKITGIIRHTVKVGCKGLIFLIVPLSCCCCKVHKSCLIDDDMKLLQEYEDSGTLFRLYRKDQGAFGGTVKLRVCDARKNRFVDEIDLRGGDHLPILDSVVGRNIYMHYSFPRKNSSAQIEDIDFDSVVLGEALLGETKLKYNYIFKNITIE